MAQHPANHGLTTTTKQSGLDDHPLGMCRSIGVGETAGFPMIGVHQANPRHFSARAYDEWPALVGHLDTMAIQRDFEGLR